jgi:hypothetical protein
MGFKEFLLTEQNDYFSEKIGDVLTSVHELLNNSDQLGARQIVKHSEGIANQIRKILHTSWPRTLLKYLRRLQKCGVAIMKAIEEKGDLKEVIESVKGEIEKISEKLGTPIHHLTTPDKKQKAEPEETTPQQAPPPQQTPQQPPPPSQQALNPPQTFT